MKFRRGRARSVVVSLAIAGALLLLGAGYATWGALAGAGQDARWASEVAQISDGGASVADDRSSVRFASGGSSACTEAEVVAVYVNLLSGYAAQYGEAVGALYVPIATRDAPVLCESAKRAQFSSVVKASQAQVVGFLLAIEAPERVTAELDGLRGVDGTREISAQTAAGVVAIQARYDGSNGLDVLILRESGGFDWSAPLRAFGL